MKLKRFRSKLTSLLLAAAILCASLSVPVGAQTINPVPGALTTVVVEAAARGNETETEQATVIQPTEASLALKENEIMVRDTLAAALLDGAPMVNISAYHVTRAQFLNIVNFVLFTEYPQITDIESYEFTMDSNSIIYGVRFHYNNSREEIQARNLQMEQAAQAVLTATVTAEMTEIQKIKSIHDYLVLNCAYDYIALETGITTPDIFNAYGVLIDKVAVCQGYAGAFQILMNKLKIPCVTVISDKMNHAWNMVQVNGLWYHVDATWDDPAPDIPGYVRHNAFMQSDTGLMGPGNDHYEWESAGYTAIDAQYDKFDWSTFEMPVLAKSALKLDTGKLSGASGGTYQFLAKNSTGEVTVISSDPRIASVTLANGSDPRGKLYTVNLLQPGTATIVVTSLDGGIGKIDVVVNAAKAA